MTAPMDASSFIVGMMTEISTTPREAGAFP
jgi:hypothetical protein